MKSATSITNRDIGRSPERRGVHRSRHRSRRDGGWRLRSGRTGRRRPGAPGAAAGGLDVMADPISDEQLFSWLERSAPELAGHLAAHPEDAPRVDHLRSTAALARELTAPPFPERIGPFRVERRLGRGGMGEVFEARAGDGTRATVKVIAGAPGEAAAARFARGCEARARLDHRGGARLLDHGTTAEGEPWLAMEFVAGVPLGERMRDASWTRGARLRFLLKLCDAVSHAHANGVLHRD